jgi:hypothetical protein
MYLLTGRGGNQTGGELAYRFVGHEEKPEKSPCPPSLSGPVDMIASLDSQMSNGV